MTDHAAEVRYLLTDARQLCDALGWSAKAKPNCGGLVIRCPSHEDSTPSCGVTKGPDGTLRAKCHACGWTADALGMIALCHGLNTSSADDFREVLAIGAHIGGDMRLEDEIRDGRQFVGQAPRKPVEPPPPEPPREYPPIAEVGQLWVTSGAVGADDDCAAYLRGRSICPIAATELGLAHALAVEATLPAWATCKDGLWAKSGHRLIVRAWDASGKLRAVRAWQVYGGAGPKRLPPSGHLHAGLVQANGRAVKMLLGQAAAGRVLICEGEPDWLTWSTRVAADVAVFGIGSGAWTPEHARKIPKGSEVLVLTHRDPAGDKYAAQVAETLQGDRVQLWRLDGTEGIDENDKAQKDILPKDPRAECIPWNEAARKVAEEEPHFVTVVEMLKDAHARLMSKEPALAWTSGHWKVDLLTGGLRPESGWVIGAASSWGKSSLMVAIADENLRNWHNKAKVLIASCEDPVSTYADRLLARRARVNAMRLRDRRLRADEHQRVCEALERAESIPFYLNGIGLTFERLLRQIDRMIQEHDIDIVALDYIQETRTKQKFESERVMFREIARSFRHLVKQRKKCSVILTQLTNPEPGKPPTKDHIRECKDIGQGAEVILMGWEPGTKVDYHGETFDKDSKLLIIDKAKSGCKRTLEMSWDPVAACFNRVLQPVHSSEEEQQWYDAEADVHDAIGSEDFDDGGDKFGAAPAGRPSMQQQGLGRW